jgi:Cu-Zn family superoxide dismutase
MGRLATTLSALLALPAAIALGGCSEHHHDAHAADAATVFKEVRTLVCVLEPTEGNTCRGVVRFTQDGDGVKVVADVEGLVANQKHAFHVHEWGDVTDRVKADSAGSHYDPDHHPHGDPAKDEKRHAGDLGNLQADASGKAHYELTIRNASLAGPENPLVGRSLIVHAKPDDFGQPTGNAGGRIASGVIGIAKP